VKILIVDDHPDTCDMLRVILRQHGHEGISATDTTDATVLVRDRAPALVLLDCHVPGLPIEQFIKVTRAHSPTTEIVLMSGSPTIKDTARALAVQRILAKPFEAEELLALLR
jgi:DNA-binding response OmpR family regulator